MVTGWKEKKLGDIANVRMCKRIFAEQTTSTGEIPFYKIGTFGEKPDAYISRALYDEYRSNYSFPSKGDILLSAAGTLGRTVVYDGKPAYFQDSNIVWLEIDKDQICNEYLNHCYQVIVWASPEGSTISRLYNGIIRNTEIILPPLPEQRRIAEVLSDMDALLTSMDKLIAKKRAIKQGAMQELLTGNLRLPGFEGKWVETTLGDTCEIKDGTHGTFARVDKGVLFLSAKNIFDNELRLGDESYITSSDYESIVSCGFPQKDDILLSCVGTIGRCCIYSGKPKAAFQRSVAFIRSRSVNPRFLLYIIQGMKTQRQLASSANASAQGGVYLGALAKIEISYPQNKAEQTAIAEILSDMDAEIDALTAKLNKLRNIKQGMMNKLLTGRIRLIEAQPTKVAVKACQEQEDQPILHVIEDAKTKGHNQQFDDAVMIAGIVNALYSEKFPLGRKRLQKSLYLLRRHQEESIELFKKMAAGPYADAIRYKGGEPIAKSCKYIVATTTKGKGTIFAPGANIKQALKYIQNWEQEADIEWVVKNLKYKKTDELELIATVDMAALELQETGTEVTVSTIKELIASSAEWKDKLKKQVFYDAGIARALKERKKLGLGG